MGSKKSELLSARTRRALTVVGCVVAISFVIWSIWSNIAPETAVFAGNDPIFVNAETGKVFHYKVLAGAPYPVPCPDTGKLTGYSAELCFWTKDGHVKSDPTPVLLNQFKGLPEPTFCPDCGRLVVFHNQMAIEGHRPPPTESEYFAARDR